MDSNEGMQRPKQPMWFVSVALLFTALIVVSYYFIDTGFPVPATRRAANSTNSVQVENGDEELARILERASTPDKTVMLTNLNKAWAEPNSVFDLMLESLRGGNNTKRLIKHLVVVSYDDKAYSRCLSLNLHCYLFRVQGFNFSEEAYFMSRNYLELVWRKIDFLHSVLSLGYNFLYSDNDIMWFRDPFPHFKDDADFYVSCDAYSGNPSDLVRNHGNTGVMYVKSNRHTIPFFELWYYSRRLYGRKHDQAAFDIIIRLGSLVKTIGLKVKFLDTTFFGGFCQPSKDINQVCTMHANCCVGLGHKVHDLKLVLDDWKKYSSTSSLPKNLPHPYKWSAPKRCRV